MNDLVILIMLVGLAGFLIWFSVQKTLEDGFFSSLGTFAVLLTAYRCVDMEGRSITGWVREMFGVSGENSISLSFWIGFLAILLPGLVVIKLLGNPRVPFPPALEKNGSMVLGLATGLVLFAAIVQSTLYFSFTKEHLAGAIEFLRPLFILLGSGHV